MTKFLCTKCSGFYNLDCTLETNSPYGLPDRCPFGVIKCGISWEIVEERSGKSGVEIEPQSDPRSACINQHGLGRSIVAEGRSPPGLIEGKPRSDPKI